ncbi:unnamed protein product [Vitrella brassicaformis CCMP3155]|uniref:Uncharacterized protein n=2 Tax=Vitrella brassicaformis TaxID=1169539 RepID=A0A0G4H6U0_VITBC|nr:unnamed protein product [Vitrella brassicaformis CCMP3155]|eukprot:CEM39559.1 unnamed protein product [Vitrella brassicaformis CCMP3155]
MRRGTCTSNIIASRIVPVMAFIDSATAHSQPISSSNAPSMPPSQPSSSAAAAAANPASPLTADDWKADGNDKFANGKYIDAYCAYLKGIRSERESLAELLVRRAQCHFALESHVSAFIDVTTALRILPLPSSLEPGSSKSALIQKTAAELYGKGIINWLNGRQGDGDVALPSPKATGRLMKDAMQHLCARVEAPGPSEPLEVADALTAGEQLQQEGRHAEARDTFTAGLAAADVSTLTALLSNASACLLKPERIREGGPDAVGCAAAALHLSCLRHGPSQQLSTIQQKCLVRLGQGLLAERLFDAADVIARATKKHASQGQMRVEADTLQQRVRSHRANARGDFDWAAIYRQARDESDNKQLDIAEYVGPLAVRHAEGQQPSVHAAKDIQVGQLLIVQRALKANPLRKEQPSALDEITPLLRSSTSAPWHPRLISQLCCLPKGRGQPSAMAAHGPPSHQTLLGLTPGFPLLPRFIQSESGEEFGSPVAAIDTGADVNDFMVRKFRMVGSVIGHISGPPSARSRSIGPGLPRVFGFWVLPSLIAHEGMKRNAIWYAIDDIIIVRAIRPIARDREITASYWNQLEGLTSNDRAMAARHQLPTAHWPDTSISTEAMPVLQQAERLIEETRDKQGEFTPTEATRRLRDVEEMLDRVRGVQELDVDTVLVPKLLLSHVALLLNLRRTNDAARRLREAVAASQGRRGYDVHDILFLANIRWNGDTMDELKNLCELLLGTSEAVDILFPSCEFGLEFLRV